MARVSTYLNFPGTTESAFTFYRKVFGGEFIGEVSRMGDMPPMEGMPPLPEAMRNLIIHIELESIAGHILMGTDAVEGMGPKFVSGNNMHINLEPDTRAEADRLFNELSDGGEITMPMAEMFWGAYYGAFSDRFGINWMINTNATE